MLFLQTAFSFEYKKFQNKKTLDMRNKQITGYTNEEIKLILDKTTDYKLKFRLCTVYQIALGKPSREIENIYHVSYKQILNWVNRFEEAGLEGLKDKSERGSGRRAREIKGYTSEDIKILLNQGLNHQVKHRLCAVYQISLGKTSRELEEFYQISHKQILNWVDNFEKFGLKGLEDKAEKGRKSRLSKQQKKQLQKVLKENSPNDIGLEGLYWNGNLVLEVIKKYFHVTYQQAQVYNLLKNLGFNYHKSQGFQFQAS